METRNTINLQGRASFQLQNIIFSHNQLILNTYSRVDMIGLIRGSTENCAKRLKLGNFEKWYKYKSEFVQENEIHRILWEFEK